jgi:hypothetical protein
MSSLSGFGVEEEVQEIPSPPSYEEVKQMVHGLTWLKDSDALEVRLLMIPRFWRKEFGLMVQNAVHEALDERRLFDVQVHAVPEEIDMMETCDRYHGRVVLNVQPFQSREAILNQTLNYYDRQCA